MLNYVGSKEEWFGEWRTSENFVSEISEGPV
jgi:hypothetical protein